MPEDARLQIVLEAKIDRLTEKLSQANRAVSVSSQRFQKDLDAADRRYVTLFGSKAPTKALQASFTEASGALSRFTGALPAGAGALTAFGAAGVAVAAGLGAIALALPKTREALDYVDEIGDSAQRLHVGVEALQEFRFASVEAGGEAKDFDEAITGLTAKVGLFTSGLAGGKVKAAFGALGLTKSQIESFSSVEELLPSIADKLAALNSEADRAALADRLGVRPLLPLLEQGSQKLGQFRDKARELNVVIDGQTIRSMGDLQRRVEIASQAIDVNLKQAFLGLAPILVTIAEKAAQVARQIADIPAAMKGLDRYLHKEAVFGVGPNASLAEVGRAPTVKQVQSGLADGSISAIALAKEFANGGTGIRAASGETPTGTLKSNIKPPPAKAANSGADGLDKALQRQKSSADAIADAQRAILEGTRSQLSYVEGITKDVQDRLDLQNQQIDADRDAANAALEKKRADNEIKAKKGDISRRLLTRRTAHSSWLRPRIICSPS